MVTNGMRNLSLSDKKEYNILTLGVSGTGKSTYINSLANYVSFGSFDEAIENEPKWLIPSTFVVSDPESYEEKLLSIGKANSSEQTDVSSSCTQHPQIYSFQQNNATINIVDVPGIGDSRGAEWDSVNVRAILDTVSQFKEIHLICIMNKSNQSILDNAYKYSLDELLIHLHKDATQNVAFIFTNSRATDYRPGDAQTLLNEYFAGLEKEKGIKISLGPENIFCVDSEAFKYQCIKHYHPQYLEGLDPEVYKTSWDISSKATKKMIQKMMSFNPLQTSDTITVNDARMIIMVLTKPLASIAGIIQTNKDNFEANTDKIVQDLRNNLTVKDYELKLTPLKHHRMVCTSRNCIEADSEDQFTTHYKQICHDECYLSGTSVSTFPEERLKDCYILTEKDNTCSVCKCSWSVHMHITYDQKKIPRESKINKMLNNLATRDETALKNIVTTYVNKLEDEQKQINDIMAKFMVYLKKNSILYYNSSYEEYIKVERTAAETANQLTRVARFDALLEEYKKRKEFFDEQSSKPHPTITVTSEDVAKLKNDLFKLELNGEKLKEIYTITTAANIEKTEAPGAGEMKMNFSLLPQNG